MAPSLSLTTYLTLARREPLLYEPKLSPTRGSALIWLHSSDPERANELVQLGQRLAAQRNQAQLLLTISSGQELPDGKPDGVTFDWAPSENPADVAKFLNHWQPACLLWLGPGLRPSLLYGTQRQSIPMVLVDADELSIESRTRWVPDSLRSTLQLFTRIYARDAKSGFRIRRMVGMSGPVEDSGALKEQSPVLSCSETDLEDLVIEDNVLTATFSVQGYDIEMKGTFEGDTYKGNISVAGYEFPVTATRKM